MVALVAAPTLALPVRAVAMSRTVGYFALVVPEVALLALPARVALALAVNVFASL